MKKLSRQDLFSLEAYAEARPAFRKQVIAHKKLRQIALGPNATLYFEDRLTIQYQVQEMLRVERIFERSAIDEEIEAYNPLIPDGTNWKATFMIEYGDENERRIALAKMIGIEAKVWAQVQGFDKVRPLADEDLERSNDDKTSAVHFLRFELSPAMIAALKSGAAVGMGIDHPAYTHSVDPLPAAVRAALVADLE